VRKLTEIVVTGSKLSSNIETSTDTECQGHDDADCYRYTGVHVNTEMKLVRLLVLGMRNYLCNSVGQSEWHSQNILKGSA